jgi:hypothetical protein
VRQTFKQYHKPTAAEFEALWQEAWIVFDASAILGLYRDSAHVVDEALKVIDAAKARLWLPYQVGLEYQTNRANVESDLFRAHNIIRKEIETKITDMLALSATNRHPFLSDAISKRVETFSKNVNKLLGRAAEASDASRLRDRIKTVRNQIDAAFETIGAPLTAAETDAIFAEGKRRYERRVPPGFADKAKDSSEIAQYGDLILWKQMIAHAKSTGRSIIFVTNDRKEDWWWFARGSILGPLPQLRSEFEEQSGQQYYSYSMEEFIKHAVPVFLKRKPTKKAEEDSATSERAESALFQKHAENAAGAWHQVSPTTEQLLSAQVTSSLAAALRGWQPPSLDPGLIAAFNALSKERISPELERAIRALSNIQVTPELLNLIRRFQDEAERAEKARALGVEQERGKLDK